MIQIGGQQPDDGRVAALLREAADGVPVPAAAPVAAIVRRGDRLRRHLLLVRAVAAVAASVLVIGVVAAVRGLDEPSGVVTGPAPITAGCMPSVTPRLLPGWARTGFSDPQPREPYVLGDSGDIAAILFGPLMAAPAADRSNKILWVSRLPVDLDVLKIDATLAGSGTVVHREVPGGPGPSIIDLPAAGCWHLRLSWNGHTDTLRLYYSPGPP